MDELIDKVDLGKIWYEYHRIAMDYGWDREVIRNLVKSERERWVFLIEEELKQKYGATGGLGGDV
jgi:hypothetical protein